MIKKCLLASEFLKVLKRNLNKGYFVFENHDWTLEFCTKKCQFKTVILSPALIYDFRKFCRVNNIEYVFFDQNHDDIKVLQ